jgi:Beta-ketoacyl synthase, N-terminal domain
MTRVWLSSIGVLGPGLNGWAQACSVLQGNQPYRAEQVQIPAPEILPPRDRRRCSDTVSLALRVALETIKATDLDAKGVPSVFAYSSGDGQIVHRLLSGVAKPNKAVSPTDFHNSVHNAPAFYWSLGTGCQESSTSIAAGRYSFAAALLKAAVESSARGKPVLMVCFDHPLPDPLAATYPIAAPFGVGMVLTPWSGDATLAMLHIDWDPSEDVPAAVDPPQIEALRVLWSGNPAARALPLLEVIANRRQAPVYVQGSHDALLRVDVRCR